ncbi:MAG: M4 family metallopeptidase [Bacteroidota bacterium]|nr:M4 family metallopeptidase [Bacteroidota bacterium]
MTRFALRRFLPVLPVAFLLLTVHASAQQGKEAVIGAHAKSGNITAAQLDRIATRFHAWQESNTLLRRHPELWNVRGLGIEQIHAYDRAFRSVPGLSVAWDENDGIPLAMSGQPLQHSRSTFGGSGSMHDRTAQAFFTAFADLLKLHGEDDRFTLLSSQRDERGRTHLRFAQQRRGIPVWGGEVICGITAAGDLDYFSGRYHPSTVPVTGRFMVGTEEALASARSWLGAQGVHIDQLQQVPAPYRAEQPSTSRCYVASDGVLLPAWVVELRPNFRDRWRIFIHAASGSVLRAYNSTCTDGPEKATATDLAGNSIPIDTYLHQGSYFMIDASRAMFDAAASVLPNNPAGAIVTLDANNSDLVNVTHVSSANNSWSDASSVSAHAHLGTVYEYFRSTHGRSAIDGRGGSMYAIVNVTQGGRSMENAFWNGQFMAFGNGGTVFDPLAGALDIAAHEMTHGVTEYTAGLEYLNQSGALNEAFSDIFAAMVDRDDWLLGEDVTRVSNDFPTGAMRDMRDPHNGSSTGAAAWQPRHMDEYVSLPESVDNGGVHVNSGIINHAAYLLSENIGRDKAERIFYDALSTKLTRQSQFIDFRLAIIRSAQELYGAVEAAAAGGACDQVGILDGNPTGDPTDYPPVDGDDRMLFVNTDPFLPAPLWVVTPPGGQNDYSSVSFTEVWSRPSVSDDGSVAVFVDTEFNIRAIALDGPPNEQVIDNSEVWNSIALSKDQKLIAVTTTLLNPEIYVLDISGVAPVARAFEVHTPNYSGTAVPNTALFPDALDFSLDNSTLLFDTYNEIDINGSRFGFWDINLMDVWDPAAGAFGSGNIERVFPQDHEVSIGNPVYARTRPTVIAFDVQFPGDATAYVMAMDLLSGDPVVVAEATYGENGYPTYNGDDSVLSFVRIAQNMSVIFNVPLAADAMTSTGDPQAFVIAGTAPVWFRTGNRPVAVRSPAPPRAQSAELAANYPNPFNPATTIPFHLQQSLHVRLSVHDVLGREVRVLVDRTLTAGSHAATWDGSDQAGRPLPSGTYYSRLTVDGRTYTKQMLYLK